MIVKIFEDYTDGIKDVKNIIFLKAVETYEIPIIKSFIERGYNINGSDEIIIEFSQDPKLFDFFLKNNGDFKECMNHWNYEKNMKDIEIQKVLIDNGHGKFVHETVGFNYALKSDPKYTDTVSMYEDSDKFNL